MADDFALGSSLVIPSSLLADLKIVDQKLKDIQTSAKATATVFTSSFKEMNASISPTINSLQTLIDNLRSVGTSATDMATAVSGAGNLSTSLSSAATSATNLGGAITKTAEAIDKISKKKVEVTFDGAMEAANTATSINSRTDAIRQLIAVRNQLSTNEDGYTQKLDAVKAKIEELNKANNEAIRTEKEKQTAEDKATRAQAQHIRTEANMQRAINQRTNATAGATNAAVRLANAQERLRRQGNLNATPQEALAQANIAKSINERTAAVKTLTAARNNLDLSEKSNIKVLEQLNSKIKELNKANKDAIASSRELSAQYNSLAAMAERMGKRLLLAFSVDTIRNFADQIVKVRGNFELQQRSLEAILQNKNEADTIFNKTVALAVKSPFKIQELVTYTKQLAAYRIESDKLYDTTKRLADVSAGLGVDMQRLILAYGQVKAAAYLRGTEVRQFTEAGVNMYGELQRYFQEVKGEAYTTAQIVDMISKRMVKFEDVEAIFQRLTDKGGLFYNMQEIQSETLQGKISNLADSFDIMFNEIGKEGEESLKGAIDGLRMLVENWEKAAAVGKALAAVLSLLYLQSLRTGVSIKAMFTTSTIGMANKTAWTIAGMQVALRNAGQAAMMFGRNLKAAFMNNLPMVLIMGAVYAITEITSSMKAQREAIRKNNAEYDAYMRNVQDLTRAYDALNDSADGTNDTKTFKEKIEILSKLNEQAKKLGIKVPVEISKVTQSNVDDVIKDLKTKMREVAAAIRDAKNFIDVDDEEISLFSDSFKEDMKEAEDAANQARDYTGRLNEIINHIGANYGSASVEVQKFYDEVKNGPQNGQSEIDWLEETSAKLTKLRREYEQTDEVLKDAGKNLPRNMSGLSGLEMSISNYHYQLEEATNEVNAFFDNLEKKGDISKYMTPAKIKDILDPTITNMDVSEFTKELMRKIAEKRYTIKFTPEIDKDETDKKLTWLDKYVQEFIESKHYSIDVEMNVDSNFDGLVERGDKAKKMFEDYAKKVERFQGVSKRKSVIDIDDEIRGFFGNTLPVTQTTIEVQKVIDKLKTLRDEAKGSAQDLGIVFDDKKKPKSPKVVDWAQLQIDLLKAMNTEYEKLAKTMGSADATQKVLDMFSGSIKETKLQLTEGFVPDKESIAKEWEKSIATIKDQSKKIKQQEALEKFKLEIVVEAEKKSLDDTKQSIEDMLTSLDLHTKLTELGLGEAEIQRMFGPLENNLDNIRQKIDDVFQGKHGTDKADWGTDVIKAYEELVKNVEKKIADHNYKTFEDLTKKYGTMLSEQLQLDLQYAKDRAAIYANVTDTELQKTYLANARKQYETKTDQNTWKQFQESGIYTMLFNNLEAQSTRMLNGMLERLRAIKETMNGLDPAALKAIAEQEDKIQKILIERNPFANLIKGIREYNSLARTRKQTEQDLLKAQKRYTEADKHSKEEMQELVDLEEKLQKLKEEGKGISPEAYGIKKQIEEKKKTLKQLDEEKKKQKEIIQSKSQDVDTTVQAEAKKRQAISKTISEITNAVSAVGQLMEKLGAANAVTKEAFDFVSNIGSAIGAYYSGNYGAMAASAIGAIGNIISMFSGDSALDEKIAKLQADVDKLAAAFQRLKKSMDDAWDSATLVEYKNKAIQNLELQIRQYQAMIDAERSKKNASQQQIQQYQNTINDLKDTIKEVSEDMKEMLGGFGAEANYKSAAQEFADAWIDAFNASEDTLEALNKTMDGFFENLIKKQLMNRLVKSRMEGVLRAIDEAVSEGSAGGNSGTDVTSEEWERIRKMAREGTAKLNEDMKNLVEVLGYVGSSSSNMSALQKGIQGITENTAEALEAVLNTIRFAIYEQGTNITAIRNILETALGSSADSPMLAELRTQTILIRSINTKLDDVIKPGHNSGGYGLKVFTS